MSNWNYRIIRKALGDTASYEIHEVYYNDKNGIESWTEEAVMPSGETSDELRNDIFYFLSAFKHPVLEISQRDGKEMLCEYGEEDEEDEMFKLNSMHYFEVMDRAFVAASHFEEFVWAHPAVQKDEQLKEPAKKIIDAMNELYQVAGRALT